jgi:hypothetical protein
VGDNQQGGTEVARVGRVGERAIRLVRLWVSSRGKVVEGMGYVVVSRGRSGWKWLSRGGVKSRKVSS